MICGPEVVEEPKVSSPVETGVSIERDEMTAAALVWDDNQKAFVWMDQATARAFPAGLAALTAALWKRTANHLHRLSSGKSSPVRASIVLKGKGLPKRTFFAEKLMLAHGHMGLVLSSSPCASTPAGLAPVLTLLQPAPVALTAVFAAVKSSPERANCLPKVLSADELRSFASLQRKMRSLCKARDTVKSEVARHGATQAARKPVPAPRAIKLPSAETLTNVFDGFLLVDPSGTIVKAKGALRRLGWHAVDLNGSQVLDLVVASDRSAVTRAITKVKAGGKSMVHDTVEILTKRGTPIMCRLTVGPLDPAEHGIFVGLIAVSNLQQATASRLTVRPKPVPHRFAA